MERVPHFTGDNGRIVCGHPRHAGRYLAAELERRPEASRISTPLGTWVRLTDEDVRHHEDFLAELYGETRPACEACADDVARHV